MNNPEVTQVKPTLAISIGDINGIGPEVILKTFEDSRLLKYVTPVVYGSSQVLAYYKKLTNCQIDYHQPQGLAQLHPKKLNVLNIWNGPVDLFPGQANTEGGRYAYLSLEHAVRDLKAGKVDGLVTAPINKQLLATQGFEYPGHTEYLTAASNKKESLMLLVREKLRVGVVTGHVPLREVSGRLTREKIAQKVDIFYQSLQIDFGIKKPRLALLGLNPHAGEEGLLGTEEQDTIVPVVEEGRNKGQFLFGPFSADGFFGSTQFHQFDGILAMYHDQGLIPFKTMAFEHGVNFTAGLDFVRTSPDHGTAYAISGKNLAIPTSFREAVYLAIDIIRHRNM